jgi:hypothetical protein
MVQLRRPKIQIKSIVFCLLFCLWAVPALTHPQANPGNAQAAASRSSSNTPSSTEIAAAKAAGKVWVNLNTGVYHKTGRWYGKTKSGKFMTVDEARKAGFKASKRE